MIVAVFAHVCAAAAAVVLVLQAGAYHGSAA
jgi:hypothetical protein